MAGEIKHSSVGSQLDQTEWEATTIHELVAQAANQVLAGPAAGVAAVPGFRALVAADLLGKLPMCIVSRSTSQTIPSGTGDPALYYISFDTEEYDNANMFDIANPDRIPSEPHGLYLITGSLSWTGSWVGSAFCAVLMYTAYGIPGAITGHHSDPHAALHEGQNATALIYNNSAAGGYIRFRASQDSGVAQVVNAGVTLGVVRLA